MTSREGLASNFTPGELVIYHRRKERIEATVHHIGRNSVCIKFIEKPGEEDFFFWAKPQLLEKKMLKYERRKQIRGEK